MGSSFPEEKVFKVSELTQLVKLTLETQFPAISVLGEASGVVLASSGHLYFTLKDAAGAMKVVMFRGSAAQEHAEAAGERPADRGQGDALGLPAARRDADHRQRHAPAGDRRHLRRPGKTQEGLPGKRLFRPAAQEAAAAAPRAHRRGHLADGGGGARHRAHPAPPLPGHRHRHLPRQGAGGRGGGRDRRRHRLLQRRRPGSEARRADRRPRRGQLRGPVGLQRGAAWSKPSTAARSR